MKYVSNKFKNIVRKGENAGYLYIFFLQNAFSGTFCSRVIKKKGLCGKGYRI